MSQSENSFFLIDSIAIKTYEAYIKQGLKSPYPYTTRLTKKLNKRYSRFYKK